MSPHRIPDNAIRRKWLAGPDGTAHVTGPYDRWRALCGATQVLERLAWPEERRCRVCVQKADELARAGEALPIGS